MLIQHLAQIAVQRFQLGCQHLGAVLQPQTSGCRCFAHIHQGVVESLDDHLRAQRILIRSDHAITLSPTQPCRQVPQSLLRGGLNSLLHPCSFHRGLNLVIVHQLQFIKPNLGQRPAGGRCLTDSRTLNGQVNGVFPVDNETGLQPVLKRNQLLGCLRDACFGAVAESFPLANAQLFDQPLYPSTGNGPSLSQGNLYARLQSLRIGLTDSGRSGGVEHRQAPSQIVLPIM